MKKMMFSLLAVASLSSVAKAQYVIPGEAVFDWTRSVFTIQAPGTACMGGLKPANSACNNNPSGFMRIGTLIEVTGTRYTIRLPQYSVVKSLRFRASDSYGNKYRAAINVRLGADVIHGQGNPNNGGSLDQAREVENMSFNATRQTGGSYRVSVQSGHYSDDTVQTSNTPVNEITIDSVAKSSIGTTEPDDMSISDLVVEFLPDQLNCSP